MRHLWTWVGTAALLGTVLACSQVERANSTGPAAPDGETSEPSPDEASLRGHLLLQSDIPGDPAVAASDGILAVLKEADVVGFRGSVSAYVSPHDALPAPLRVAAGTPSWDLLQLVPVGAAGEFKFVTTSGTYFLGIGVLDSGEPIGANKRVNIATWLEITLQPGNKLYRTILYGDGRAHFR